MLADRITLTINDDDPAKLTPMLQPLAVQSAKIARIGAEQYASFLRRKLQLGLVIRTRAADLDGGQHVDQAHTEGRDQPVVHGILVQVQPDLTHGRFGWP